MAERDTITASTVMDPEEGMRLLAEGKVDAAFVWGPSAGYDNRALLHDAYYVRPVDGAQMHYDAAIGFSNKSKELRDQVDRCAACTRRQDRRAARRSTPCPTGRP